MSFTETAWAKINLALHVRRRREDGYHELESIFAFVDGGDELRAEPADQDSLTISGEFGVSLSAGPDNLVLQALAAMRGLGPVPPLAIHLEKRLPVAAGIGGGSADAAAMIRLLDRHFIHSGNEEALVRATAALGADIGACIVSRTRIGTGTGNDLHLPAADDAAGRAVLLVNPRLPLSTGPVFKGWDGVDRGGLSPGSVTAAALAGRNDLEAPAIALCPAIAGVLAALRGGGPLLARMSGSGATCFALYESAPARADAAAAIRAARPGWWLMEGNLR